MFDVGTAAEPAAAGRAIAKVIAAWLEFHFSGATRPIPSQCGRHGHVDCNNSTARRLPCRSTTPLTATAARFSVPAAL